MDQIVSDSIHHQQNCIIHPQNKIAFVQVKEISTHSNSNIFQCVDCFEQDLQFKGANHMLIQKIIQNSDSDFHYKWPPLNDQFIIQKIHLKAKNLNSTQTILNQIESYFSKLKDEIIQKIDESQNKAIKQVHEMPFGKEQILRRYQEISQIQNLKSLLAQDQNKSFDQYQKQCKDFIQQVELQKDKNTQLLQELLSQCDKVQQLVNFDRLNQTKSLILDFLDSLSVFEDQTQRQGKMYNEQVNISLSQQDNSKVNKLMQLISNKTNYCSEEFLNQLRKQMQKYSQLFEQISFDKMNQENKKGIRFSELNDEKLKNINEYVEHLIKIQNNPQYVQQVRISNQISNLLNTLDNKFNFISNKYRDNFMDYLIETYPFQQNLNTNEMYSDEQSFNCLRSLELNYAKEFVKLVKKKKNLDENQQNFENSQTKRIQQCIVNKFKIDKNQLENSLKQFPIFDLYQVLQEKNILNELQLQKSKLKDGNQRIEIVKNVNSQFEISINEANYQGRYKDNFTNCISQKLEKDKKYIFRIQFKKGSKGYFVIGLMQNNNLNNSVGYNDNMSYQLYFKDNKMKYMLGYGIDKFIKGDSNQELEENSILELRVWLQGQQLEVLNYPNYNYHVQITDGCKQNLLQNDLCLYFGMQSNLDKYILLEALTVEQF